MTAPRLEFEALAERLFKLDSRRLERVIRARLLREAVEELPRMGRDEDPADILIDLTDWLSEHRRAWKLLPEVCAHIADDWATVTRVRTRPEPLGELHYLCARIGAVDARNGIARVISRGDLRGILLPGGEGLQLRALRCLAGLLTLVQSEEREKFMPYFVRALEVPQHVSIALTVLVAIYPRSREQYVSEARERWPFQLERALSGLDRNVALLRAEMGGR